MSSETLDSLLRGKVLRRRKYYIFTKFKRDKALQEKLLVSFEDCEICFIIILRDHQLYIMRHRWSVGQKYREICLTEAHRGKIFSLYQNNICQQLVISCRNTTDIDQTLYKKTNKHFWKNPSTID